ncbi:MAG TPA: hypothetical protein VGK67_37695 [Myxococcales bacterium]
MESSTPGKPVLYVVSSNFDLRYSRGTVIAVDTSKLSEPPDGVLDRGATPAVDPEKGFALIDSFGGEIGTYAPASSSAVRLFVPTRSANRLYALTADGAKLSCLPDAATDKGQDCLDQGITLQDATDSKKRTVDPFGVTVVGSRVFITHLHITDDPPLSGKNRVSYLASLDAETLGGLSFLDIGLAPAQGMAMTPNGLYLAGRELTSSSDQLSSQALRFVSGTTINDVGLTSSIHVYEARGVALASDQARLFATTRSPDGLLVLDITLDPTSGQPRNRVLSFTSLPTGPAEMLVIPRPGRRDLVAVSCTSSNSVALYDDELGEPAGLVQGILEPFAMARSGIPGRPQGARLYVASFGNHTVDVVDILDVDRPRGALVVGQLGFGAHRPLGLDLPEGAK